MDDDADFNRQLARSYANATWSNAGGALGFMLVSCVFNPFLVFTLLAAAGSLNGVLRVFTMPKELRGATNPLEMVVQAALAGVVCLCTLGPLVVMAVTLVLAGVLGFFT